MAQERPLGEVIGERELLFTRRDGTTELVIVRIGKPMITDPNNEDWYCPYQISGFGREKKMAMVGVDSVQALVLTLQVIPAELDHLAKRERGFFKWFDDRDLGFPEQVPSERTGNSGDRDAP